MGDVLFKTKNLVTVLQKVQLYIVRLNHVTSLGIVWLMSCVPSCNLIAFSYEMIFFSLHHVSCAFISEAVIGIRGQN